MDVSKKYKDLEKLSGEDNVMSKPTYNLPIIRFNGTGGKFYKNIVNNEGNKEKIDLGESIKGTMMKIRRVLTSFTSDYSMSTNEHNSWRDTVSLFQMKKTDKGWKRSYVETSPVKVLREKYQNLKMNQVVYFLLEPDKEVVKLILKGKGLGNLFKFYEEIDGKKDEHIYHFLIEIGATLEEGPLGTYYANTFTRLQEVEDMDLVAKELREVADNLAKIESYYESQAPATQEEEADIPTIQEGEQSSDMSKAEVDSLEKEEKEASEELNKELNLEPDFTK